ncbi:sensor histidine kinase [Hymenobacter weizhouensis]|uniref:sensor histidine kinase n=1 Tax=Hymenobacter sp. YIM 151500-1 TaxID=2987689 RepID=UPI0022260C93|nr:histidine kinase [Hymenobacter sp. YIM 151500-1]UYZ63528.1 histidine kinase [Hymenobacter sp. YIM 151500-1]
MPPPLPPPARALPVLNDRRFLLLGIPTLAVLVLLPRGLLRVTSVAEFLGTWGVSLVFTTVFWLTGRALWFALFRRLPLVEQTRRRLWLLAIINTAITALVTVGLCTGLALLHGSGAWLTPAALLGEFGLNMVPTVVIQLIYESWHFFRQWEDNVRRTEQLQRAGVQSQLEALQNQLDPHFLFNSLNTLSALIEPDNEPAQQFVEQLSDVYRYVLLARTAPTVPLREELAFVDTYLALHQARFGDKLRVTRAVPPAALAARVAPLSVQLLVENALKHNVASREFPLELHLSADPTAGYFTVENTLRPRPAGLAPGTGTGLANVRHRYELLRAPRPVAVCTDHGRFRVQLPLLM